MLGTDYPFPLGEVHGFAGAYPGKIIEEMGYTKELEDKLFFDNAAEFLGIDKNQYS